MILAGDAQKFIIRARHPMIAVVAITTPTPLALDDNKNGINQWL
jgi:hypothetical protein